MTCLYTMINIMNTVYDRGHVCSLWWEIMGLKVYCSFQNLKNNFILRNLQLFNKNITVKVFICYSVIRINVRPVRVYF